MNEPLIIHIESPWPGWWSATPDGFDGTRCDDPRQEDQRIGLQQTKWDAIRELIDRMEQAEESQKETAGIA